MNVKPLTGIVMLCACSSLLFSCSNDAKSGEQQMPQASLETMTVKTESRTLDRTFSATIRGRQDIEVYPEVSGKLTRLLVTEGQHVSQGQVMFVIDQIPFQAAVQTSEANVKAAQAALATAQLNYTSQKKLFDENVVSQFDLQTAENSLLSAQAALAQARAQLTIANNNLSYCSVKSPSNGVVGTLPYRLGALVSPSMPQSLTTVSDNTEMYVYFSMAEKDIIDLARQYGSLDAAIGSMPPVYLQLSDGSRYDLPGIVETASGVISSTTGSSSLRAKFANPDRFLVSGSTGAIVVPTDYKDVIVIPQAATFNMQDKTVCYKVVEGVTQSQIIEVAPINNGQEYIVTSGLQAGDVIVASGAGLVREGTPVAPQAANQAKAQ